MIIAWPILRIFNHLTMANRMPLADEWLSAADLALGFDWLGYVLWADQNPILLYAMDFTYTGLDYYAAFLFIVLALRPDAVLRCQELIRLFLMTAIPITAIGALFPAKAAMAYYAPSGTLFQHISDTTGSYHMAAMQALRNDPYHVLDLQHLPGLVTFPSFHTAMGIVAIYCARGHSIIFALMVLINITMIASTPVFGSHYAIDIIAGIAFSLLAIAIHRKFVDSPDTQQPAVPSLAHA